MSKLLNLTYNYNPLLMIKSNIMTLNNATKKIVKELEEIHNYKMH